MSDMSITVIDVYRYGHEIWWGIAQLAEDYINIGTWEIKWALFGEFQFEAESVSSSYCLHVYLFVTDIYWECVNWSLDNWVH